MRRILLPLLRLVATARACDDARQRQLSCNGITGFANRYLCPGVARLHNASCAELLNSSFLHAVISSVGLVPDGRAQQLYGEAHVHMLCRPGPGCDPSRQRVGLWQDPKQLAAMLVHLATNPRIGSISTYLENGVFSGWTCAIVIAYLQRVGQATSFEGAAIDITKAHLGGATERLLRRHNVSYVHRTGLGDWLQAVQTRRGGRPVDLCFIDANHSYAAAREDFEALAPVCRNVMFHDIQDSTTIESHLRDGGGGVPSLWHQVLSSVKRKRVAAFTEQHSTAMPVFGIGVLSSNDDRGTAEPDFQDAWRAWGRGMDAWKSLCAASKGSARAGSPLRLHCARSEAAAPVSSGRWARRSW